VQMEGVLIPGHHQPGDDGTPIDATQVEPDYFRVFGVPLVKGRNFGPADREGTSPVVIINEVMADRFWPDQDPIGKRIYTDGFDEPPHEVVGVARNHKVRSIGEDPTPYLYFPLEQSPSVATSLFVRARGSAAAILPDVRREVLAMNPSIVFTDASTASEVVDLTLMPTRVGAVLLGGFGLLALGLAAIGLYGVIAYTVSRRTREVGLRMAMGARVTDVIRMILGQGLKLAIWGIGIGSVASIWVGNFLRALLYGVSAMDPFAFALAGLVLLVVAAVANVVPALRAARVSPISALRYE
jgi:predicted permease